MRLRPILLVALATFPVISAAGFAVALPPEEGDTDPYQPTVLQQGTNWSLINASGFANDDWGQYYSQNLYVAQGWTGAQNLPISYGLANDLLYDADSEDATIIIDQRIADEIQQSEWQGYLTPYLQSIAEPGEGGGGEEPYLPYGGASGGGDSALSVPGDQINPFFGRCSNREYSRSKNLNLSQPITLWNPNFGNGFSGTLQISGNVQGQATGQIYLQLKRYAIFGACIPYSVKFDRARAFGNLRVDYGATLSGSVNYSNPTPWEWEIAKPFLFSIDFMIGPIPVHVGFKLPIVAGLELQASVTGSVTYNTGQSAQGPFDYTCTVDGCQGWNNVVQSSVQPAQTLTGSVSGRIKPSAYAQAALRAYLYWEKLVYAQVGLRPYLHGDLWGYYGNNCGDADGDGYYETVEALTFDLNWALRITAQASVLNKTPKRWDLGGTSPQYVGFWDLIDSSALKPMLVAAASVPANTSQRYDAKMRPCWPYGDNVNYNLAWGDGTSTNLVGPPQAFTSTYRTWTTQGSKALSLTALSDVHGRQFGNKVTNRTIQVTAAPTGTWTTWLNRDAPSGVGDWETLVDFRAAGTNICAGATPIGIECRTISGGVDWRNTGEVYSCVANSGGICQNAQQPDGSCQDYQVRFLCP